MASDSLKRFAASAVKQHMFSQQKQMKSVFLFFKICHFFDIFVYFS